MKYELHVRTVDGWYVERCDFQLGDEIYGDDTEGIALIFRPAKDDEMYEIAKEASELAQSRWLK